MLITQAFVIASEIRHVGMILPWSTYFFSSCATKRQVTNTSIFKSGEMIRMIMRKKNKRRWFDTLFAFKIVNCRKNQKYVKKLFRLLISKRDLTSDLWKLFNIAAKVLQKDSRLTNYHYYKFSYVIITTYHSYSCRFQSLNQKKKRLCYVYSLNRKNEGENA